MSRQKSRWEIRVSRRIQRETGVQYPVVRAWVRTTGRDLFADMIMTTLKTGPVDRDKTKEFEAALVSKGKEYFTEDRRAQ